MRSIRLMVYLLVFGSLAAGVATAAPHGVAPGRSSVTRPVSTLHRQQAPQWSARPKGEDRPDSTAGPTGPTGLPNAIAHVQGNLSLHPNKGLQNALDRLQSNEAKHTDGRDWPKRP